jgi:hypothetical protein
VSTAKKIVLKTDGLSFLGKKLLPKHGRKTKTRHRSAKIFFLATCFELEERKKLA